MKFHTKCQVVLQIRYEISYNEIRNYGNSEKLVRKEVPGLATRAWPHFAQEVGDLPGNKGYFMNLMKTQI